MRQLLFEKTNRTSTVRAPSRSHVKQAARLSREMASSRCARPWHCRLHTFRESSSWHWHTARGFVAADLGTAVVASWRARGWPWRSAGPMSQRWRRRRQGTRTIVRFGGAGRTTGPPGRSGLLCPRPDKAHRRSPPSKPREQTAQLRPKATYRTPPLYKSGPYPSRRALASTTIREIRQTSTSNVLYLAS
jgi:hypothetical protein